MARTKKAETRNAAALLGAKGGAAGVGDSKRRGVDYAALGASAWSSMSAEERSKEMKRRRRKGLKASKAAAR